MKTKVETVAAYLAAQPEGARAALKLVRATIRKAMPDAEEVVSYQIPTYKLDGRAVLYFAGWKQHYSIYPASQPMVETFERELSPYQVQKGTIRFPLSEPVPVKLIARLAKFRVKESAGRRKAKAPAKKR